MKEKIGRTIRHIIYWLIGFVALLFGLSWGILIFSILSWQTKLYIACIVAAVLLLYPLMSKKAMIKTAVLCLAVFLSYKYVTADPPGYCKAQNRYISDTEFANTVIVLVQADIKRRKPQKGDSSFYEDWDGYIPTIGDSSDIEVRREATHSAINRMFGWQEVEVWISPPKKKGTWYSAPAFYFDVCGTLLDSYIGMPYSYSDPVTTTSIGKQHGF